MPESVRSYFAVEARSFRVMFFFSLPDRELKLRDLAPKESWSADLIESLIGVKMSSMHFLKSYISGLIDFKNGY